MRLHITPLLATWGPHAVLIETLRLPLLNPGSLDLGFHPAVKNNILRLAYVDRLQVSWCVYRFFSASKSFLTISYQALPKLHRSLPHASLALSKALPAEADTTASHSALWPLL